MSLSSGALETEDPEDDHREMVENIMVMADSIDQSLVMVLN